jgi:outer membrane protein assembly factor BamA
VTATTKEQLLVNAQINSSALDNRRHFEGDNRLYWTSQKTYGLGTSTAEDAAVDQKYDYALFDSRDGAINPSRGVYASLAYRAFFEGFLGGATSWQELSHDGRSYLRLSRDARHKLAFWLSGHLVVGGIAPYLDLPATGMDTYGRAGRGYPQGRFRGERLVYGEAEYRWMATRNGLFGMVAFLNAQTLGSDETGEGLFDAFTPGAGLGFRLMLNKRSQTNLCLDIGWGKDGSNAVYFAVQEAF